MQENYNRLVQLLQDAYDLSSAAMLLRWDQQTKMPNGATQRGRQLATLNRYHHMLWTSDDLGTLLDDLIPYGETLDFDSDEAAMIRMAEREYTRRRRVPVDFMQQVSRHQAESFSVWASARPENDFESVKPYLEKTLEYSLEYANFFPHDHPADPMLAEGNPGMDAATVQALFDELRPALVNIVETIRNLPDIDDSIIYGNFPVETQYEFVREAITAFGYDWQRGRMDDTHHPFAVPVGQNDVRLTTRADANHLGDGLFATMHESGHAMYGQGVNNRISDTYMIRGASAGVHESQSRLWENRVGRSREFWLHYYPRLQELFPDELADVARDDFYRAINKVQPSLIRVQADEVTYNLHIMIRSALGMQLLTGELSIADLPDAWNARYESDLGITPPDYKDGVMQDVHWYTAFIGGAFAGYTLGNILGAQYYNAALDAHPNITDEIAHGEFGTLFNWLKTNIWQHGRKYTPQELTQRLTGNDISVQPLIDYLHTKFGDVYQVDFTSS